MEDLKSNFLNLIKTISKNKYEIYLYALDFKGTLKSNFLSLSDLHIIKSENFVFKYFDLFFLKNNKDIIVHTFLPKSYLVASFLRIFCKIKYLICSRRSRNFYQNKNFLYKILETFAHKKTNIFLCNANIIKKDLISEGVDEKKIHVIYNSLDI